MKINQLSMNQQQQEPLLQSQVVESTTLKTIRNLKKLQEQSSNNYDENNGDQYSTTQGSYEKGKDTNRRASFQVNEIKKRNSFTNDQAIKSQQQIIISKQEVNQFLEQKNANGNNQTIKKNRLQLNQKLDKIDTQMQDQAYNCPRKVSSEYKCDYVNIDMNNALNLVTQKSKQVREAIEQMQLPNSFIQKNVIQNKHFSIGLNSKMQHLIKIEGKLNQALTNIPKSSIESLEQYTLKHINKCISIDKISQEYNEKMISIDKIIERRLSEINENIKNMKQF